MGIFCVSDVMPCKMDREFTGRYFPGRLRMSISVDLVLVVTWNMGINFLGINLHNC